MLGTYAFIAESIGESGFHQMLRAGYIVKRGRFSGQGYDNSQLQSLHVFRLRLFAHENTQTRTDADMFVFHKKWLLSFQIQNCFTLPSNRRSSACVGACVPEKPEGLVWPVSEY